MIIAVASRRNRGEPRPTMMIVAKNIKLVLNMFWRVLFRRNIYSLS